MSSNTNIPSTVPRSQPQQSTNSAGNLQEQRNSISRPEDPEHQLFLSEGPYQLRDEITLSWIQPYPTDAMVSNPNVLDPKPVPPTSGTRLSIALLAPRRVPARFRYLTSTIDSKSSLPNSITEDSRDSSHSGSDQGSSRFSGFGLAAFRTKFGDSDANTSQTNGRDSKDHLKRKKPKSSIGKTGSSFISRTMPHESLTKRLNEHNPETPFAFANLSRGMLWLDMGSPNKQDQLMKILFTRAHALCHDFNENTKVFNHIDLVIGFSTSEIIWYEAFSQKYSRINKNGIINNSPVSDIKWLPGSENTFAAAHVDGSVIMYDKERDDAPFTPEDDSTSSSNIKRNGKPTPKFLIKKSLQSKNQKSNPIACWKAAGQRINRMEFSPNGELLALVCEDGSLRIIDHEREQLLDLFSSYFGGLTCVAWSPDGMYVITGGQDDLISIWSVFEHALVARCVGHRSWVSSLSFDPWRCDENQYRFGSVGEDARLLLWDFSVGMLNRPRTTSMRQSISSYAQSGDPDRSNSEVTLTQTQTDPDSARESSDEDEEIVHPIVPRGLVASIPPVLSKEVDQHPLSWIGFEEDGILVACKFGHIRTWDRPKEEDKETSVHDFGNPFTS